MTTDITAPNPVLAEHARVIHELAKRTCEDIIDIGRHLAEAREHVGHGSWLDWIETEFGWSDQTAYRFIHVYELSRDAKFHTLVESDLPFAALYRLAAPKTPEAALIEVAERIEAGEKVTSAQVTEVIAKAKDEIASTDKTEPEPAADAPLVIWDHITGKEVVLDGTSTDKFALDSEDQADDAEPEPKKSLLELELELEGLTDTWEMSTPEERQAVHDRLADFFVQVAGIDIVACIPESMYADVVRRLMDQMGVDDVLEAASPAFRQALCVKLPGKPKKFKTEHAVQTGTDETGKPIFALEGRGNRSRPH